MTQLCFLCVTQLCVSTLCTDLYIPKFGLCYKLVTVSFTQDRDPNIKQQQLSFCMLLACDSGYIIIMYVCVCVCVCVFAVCVCVCVCVVVFITVRLLDRREGQPSWRRTSGRPPRPLAMTSSDSSVPAWLTSVCTTPPSFWPRPLTQVGQEVNLL